MGPKGLLPELEQRMHEKHEFVFTKEQCGRILYAWLEGESMAPTPTPRARPCFKDQLPARCMPAQRYPLPFRALDLTDWLLLPQMRG